MEGSSVRTNYSNVINNNSIIKHYVMGMSRFLILWIISYKGPIHGYAILKELDVFFSTLIDEGSLKKSNLGEIVNTMKENGELERLETKTESTFTIEDLVKIIIFQMKDNILNISANDFKFNFNIEGTLNKEITLTKPIETDFQLSEIEKNATCKFSVGTNKLDANLSCNLDVKDYKNIETFSFKTAQIITEDNEIYLSKLNDIILINSKEKEDDDNNKTVIIIIVVVCSVVVAAGLGIGIFFLVKKLRTKTNGVNKAEENNQRIDVKNNDGAESGNRVISYGNTNKK